MLIFHSVVTRFAGFIFHTWAVAVAELGAKVFVITIFSNTKHGHTEHTNAYMELPFYFDKLINVAVYRQLMQLFSCLCVSIDCFGCEASTATTENDVRVHAQWKCQIHPGDNEMCLLLNCVGSSEDRILCAIVRLQFSISQTSDI